MRRMRLSSFALIAMMLVGTQLPMRAQTTDGGSPSTAVQAKKVKHPKHHKETAEEIELREMRETLKAQQKQIDALKALISAKSGDVTAAQQTAAAAQTQAAAASAAAAQAQAAAEKSKWKATAASNSVAAMKMTTVELNAETELREKKLEHEINDPSSLHFKGMTLTPGGFAAFEGVWRQHTVNSGINTPFNAIPLPGANEGHIDELNFSGRQSRVTLYATGGPGSYKISGYYEVDWLGTGITSNSNESNSYVLRQRQIWGQFAAASGFAVTGGQMWSLVTEDAKGTDARTEIVPATIDPQYMVGYNWTRQPGIRVQQRFGNYNNVAPDFMVKVALDLAHVHAEIGGLARFMRDYYYPILTASAASGYTYSPGPSVSHTADAGGVFGAVRVTPNQYFDIALQAMAGPGVGRYGASQLADATVKPDGTLEPIRNYHGLTSVTVHPTRKLDVFAYYGGEYDQRTVYTSETGALMGYGAPNLVDTGCYAIGANPGSSTGGSIVAANCNSPTRYIQEPMAGFIYRVIDNPKYGRLQYWVTYSYLQRNLWSGNNISTTTGLPTGPSGPRAEDPMIHISMRYYIP